MKLKDLKPGTEVQLKNLSHESHETKPPGRFQESSLIKKLSDLNIGRPSTFSSIVSLVQDRGYVAKKGSQLYPTPLGFAVARLLSAKLPTFTDYGYTSDMEAELDEIAEWKQTRKPFLDAFWNGKAGFHQLIEDLKQNIDFAEIEQFTKIDLHNGYSIRFSKFGTYLQDDNGEKNEKGYLPSARIDDDSDVWDYRDPEVCAELIASSVNAVGPQELGVLSSGEYTGWTVYAKSGRYGDFVQALHPDHVKANADGKKPKAATPNPINHALPEGQDLDSVTLKSVESLFAEVKLPRTLTPQLFTGIGKRGPWLGWKATAKSRRATFISLPEGLDPRTVTAEEAQQVWDDKQQAKRDAEKKKADRAAPKPKAAAAKKSPAKKPAARKPAVKK